MKKLLPYLKSLRLSLALMVALVPVIAAGNLVPQRGRTAPWVLEKWQENYPLFSRVVDFAGLDHVYTSWWFIIIFAVLFLNISLVTWDLILRTSRKAKGLHRFSQKTVTYFSLGTSGYRASLYACFEKALRDRRYRVMASEEEIYARKGWMGIWGGTVLHVGLVVILAGAVVSGLFRFSGYIEVGEGQTFVDSAESYFQSSQGPLFPGHRPEVQIKVEKIIEEDWGKIKKISSTVALSDAGRLVRRKSLKMNEPLYFRGMKVFQSRYFGDALLVAISSPNGAAPYAGYVNFKRSVDKTESSIFSIKGTPFQAKVVYSPGSDVFDLELHEKDKLLYQGFLGMGQSLMLDSYKVTFVDMALWSGIIVVYDWSVPIVFAGFALAVGGIAVMGLFDPREIWAKVVERDGEKFIEVFGWGRWKNMFQDEFQEIMEGVEGWKS